jgi:integrase
VSRAASAVRSLAAAPAWSDTLHGRLLAVLRPQFADEVIVPDPDDPVLGGARCAVAGCDRLIQSRDLCGSHYSRWRKSGRPDVAEFISTTAPLAARSGVRPTQCYDLRGLPRGLRLEVAYALQCRLDERSARLRPGQVARAVKILAASGVSSLLHRSLRYWRAKAGQRPSGHPGGLRHTEAGAFLRYAYQRLDDVARGARRDDEYDRDTWDARRLGLPATGSSYLIRFGGIAQPWLRAAAKRWGRHRLGSGKAIGTVAGDALALTWFARFVAEIAPAARDESVITRGLLERYLARLATTDLTAQTRLGYLVDLRSFLDACRRYHWLPRLPEGAALYPDDMPRRGQYLPRFIPEAVMAQLEREDNLARIADPTTRHLIIVLIETGLRASDACRLPVNGLVDDSARWPCLRFFNSKVKTEQLVPLSAKAASAIKAQQQHVRERWPAGTRWLFPRVQSNPDGARPFSYATLHHRLDRWQDDIDVRDEAGDPVRVSAHRFRHTLGTRLINSGVPEHVVQKLLGHKSPQMTSRYASLHATTLRAEFDRYCEQRVNITGELIDYDPQSPVADAEWVKHKLNRVRDSLPNGFCGRPPQQDCPHPNACLTCPDFQTTPEFLPTHRAQRERTAVLIATADQLGQSRQAANHRRVAANLDRIISALEAPPNPTQKQRPDAR